MQLAGLIERRREVGRNAASEQSRDQWAPEQSIEMVKHYPLRMAIERGRAGLSQSMHPVSYINE